MPALRFVLSIQDTVYFHWQLAIFLESLAEQLPAGSGVDVVVSNDFAPLSADLAAVIAAYRPVVRCLLGTDYGKRPVDVQVDNAFEGTVPAPAGSHAGVDVYWRRTPRGYLALNRVEALRVVGESLASEMIALMDPDIFLYGSLNAAALPSGNALQANPHIDRDPFLGGPVTGDSPRKGVLLKVLLRALQCENEFQAGGVTVFLDADTLRNKKFIADCFRFSQLVYLAGQIVEVRRAWMAETACYSLSLTYNGIPYVLMNRPEYSVQIAAPTIPSGTFYHYYAERNSNGVGAFPGSPWHKKEYWSKNFLRTADLDSLRGEAVTDHHRTFLTLATAAKRRLGW